MTEDGQRDASTNGSTRRTMGAQFCSQGMNLPRLRNENHENVLAQFSARPTRRARAYYQFGGLEECHVINDVMLFRSASASPCPGSRVPFRDRFCLICVQLRSFHQPYSSGISKRIILLRTMIVVH